MTTPVFLTIDTEFAWRHHAAGLDGDAVYARSVEPAGVGLEYQLEVLATHRLKACFFVDPMPALVYGIEPVRRMVSAILGAGQEVQLHLHPGWRGASLEDRTAAEPRREMRDHDRAAQDALIRQATSLLQAAGAPMPVAFRAGTYGANDDTLAVLAAHGFRYDSSHNGARRDTSAIGLPDGQIAPVPRAGIVELPITTLHDGRGLRPLQLCALSSREIRAALDHAVRHDHAAVTIVSHCFELANRAGTRANHVHLRRFQMLCRLLDEQRDVLPTARFADMPVLRLDAHDRPAAMPRIERHRRQAEQLWSNWVAERAVS